VSDVALTGETVTLSSAADVTVGRGRFRLENQGSEPIQIALVDAALRVGEDSVEVIPKTIFDVEHDRALPLDGFSLEPGALAFLLGFPAVPWERAPTTVVLRLRAGDDVLEAESPVVYERRIPRRR
jgi:hypothetical protein